LDFDFFVASLGIGFAGLGEESTRSGITRTLSSDTDVGFFGDSFPFAALCFGVTGPLTLGLLTACDSSIADFSFNPVPVNKTAKPKQTSATR
jgi:hypothetical protein